jgi:hypothetical protein
VSRGIGPVQRRVCDVLLEYEGLAVETTGLKGLVSPEGDRSNLRRAIRTGVRRGLLHEWSEDGRRYYELSFVGWILAVPLPPDDPAMKPPGRTPEPSSRRSGCRLNGRPHG